MGTLTGTGRRIVFPIAQNSPAFDSGNSDHCQDVDQRGLVRAAEACDVGAFEYDKTSFFLIPIPGNKAVIFPS